MATLPADHDTHNEPTGSPPHHVLARVSTLETAVTLIAAVEGEARLIETMPLRDAMDDDLLGAVAAVRLRTGFPLPTDAGRLDGVIVESHPLAVLLIGERDVQDAAALETVRSVGAARYFSIPSIPPPRPHRDAAWVQAVLAAWRAGTVDAICAVLPTGPFPVWAAQLFTALVAITDRPPPLLVISSGLDADLLPWFARGMTRGAALADELASALAAIACATRIAGVPHPPPCAFRTHALATAVIAARNLLGGAVCYCDIGTGTTLIAADDSGVHVGHDPQRDCGAGAAALLAGGGHGAVAPWLPEGVTADTARAWSLRRAAAPDAMLTDPTDRAIAGAFARVALAAAVRDRPTRDAGYDTLILGPGWLRWSTPEEMLHIALDVLAPPRSLYVALDHDDLLGVAGFLARDHPERAASIFTHDALHPLGTLIAPAAPQRHGQARPLTLVLPDGTAPTVIAPQSVTRVAIDAPTRCELSGGGGPPRAFDVSAAEFGLLIDTRNRPLQASHARGVPRTSVSDRLRVPS